MPAHTADIASCKFKLNWFTEWIKVQTNIETTKQHSGQQQQTSLVVANCWFFGEWVIYTTKNQVINCTNIYWEKLIKFKSWISLYYLHFTRKFRCFTITFVLPQQIHHGGSSTILSRPNTVVWDIRLINMWNDFLIWHIMWQYYWPIGKGNRQMIRHCMSWCNWPIIWPEYSSNVGINHAVRQRWVIMVKFCWWKIHWILRYSCHGQHNI